MNIIPNYGINPYEGEAPAHSGIDLQTPSVRERGWGDIEALFVELGATITQAEGSRIGVRLFDERRVFHRPHPSPHTDKGAVASVREWLKANGVAP